MSDSDIKEAEQLGELIGISTGTPTGSPEERED